MRHAASAPIELPVGLDRAAALPLPAQLAAALRDLIDAGNLRPGDSLPATRRLASRLSVARGVVVAAYEQLVAEGYLHAVRGSGTVVNPQLAAQQRPQAGALVAAGATGAAEPGETAVDPRRGAGAGSVPADVERTEPGRRPPLAPGTPITDATQRPAWRSAWRWAANQAVDRAPAQGEPSLRRELAEHLRLVRGTPRPSGDVLVTAGAREGLGLLLTALGAGREAPLVVGVEDPGYPSLRSVASRAGARIVSLPVDEDGLRTDALPSGLLDLLIVTPSHQYPIGGSLPLPRRRELLRWAGRTGAIIIEDDYDSELRHVGSPLPTLAALDDPTSGSVVTLGTFSSTISPALAAGFLLAPARLRAVIEPAREDLGSPVSSVAQLALADYLASGELRRNIARVRRRHSVRRDLLSERLAGIPGARLRPMSGGLHAVVEFSGTRERALAREEQAVRDGAEAVRGLPAGIGIAALGSYWQHHRADRVAGVVLGMGGPDAEEFECAVERLRAILRG